jgi:predicted Zn-dependent protease
MHRIIFILLLAVSMPSFAASNNLPILGDSTSGLISLDQEYRLGRIWLRNLRKQATTLNNPVLTDFTEELIYRLASNSQVTDRRLEIVILDSKELNAFAVPGGVIGINAGLFLHAENEAQFAAVLAHELAHLSQRHFARQVDEARKRAPIAIASLLGSIMLLATSNTEAGLAGLMTGQAATTQMALNYSRDAEREADRLGLHTLVAAEINPKGMPEMFRQMFDSHKYSQRPPEFLLTHPVTENRISDAAARVDSLNTLGFEENIDYQLMRTAIQVQYLPNSHDETFFRDLVRKSTSLLTKQIATYGLNMVLIKQEKFKQALTQTKNLLAIDGTKIPYLILQQLVTFELGETKTALTTLAQLIEINPDNHSLIMTYSGLLAKDGQFELAAMVLKKHSQIRSTDPSIWQQLTEYESKTGNEVSMLQAYAEYLFLTGQKSNAVTQLKRALKMSTGNFLISARIEQRAREIENTNEDMSF